MREMALLYLFHYLLLLILCLSFTNQLTYSANTIIPGRPLSGNRTITSSNGAFMLGFFKPGISSKYYIGIWSKNVLNKLVVWVANRGTPASDTSSSQLKIAEDGNLVITDKNNIQIWSTDLTFISANSTQAVLLDNGNLVLINWPSSVAEGKPSSPALWQSFDHPTDTWLYGGKIGFSKLTNRSQMLTSWRSADDPAEGQFSLTMDHTGTAARLMLLNRSEVYCKSWIREHFFQYFSNENESYFSYNPYYADFFLQLNTSGIIKILQKSSVIDAQPNCLSMNCGAYGICDMSSLPICKCVTGFTPKKLDEWTSADFSSGCVRISSVRCEDMKEDKFLRTNTLDFKSGKELIDFGKLKGCRRKCLNDCDCTAYADDNGRCLIWHGDLMFTSKYNRSWQEIGVYYRLPKLDQNDVIPRETIIGIAVGAVVLVGFLLVLLYRYRRKQLIAPDSTYIAVKKLKLASKAEQQFRNEVKTVGAIQHVNLIRLRGFCAEKTHRLLVYEYMPKGSLDFYLLGKTSQVLDWGTRYKIAIGAAQGLAYLHESCRECIIHCDVKPANILLDEEFNPKVADFGLAKLFDRDFSRVLTTMRGTQGYIAPEWLSAEAVTPKVDVYSYGMMLFEIISGRRNLEIIAEDMVDYFPTRAELLELLLGAFRMLLRIGHQ